MTSSRSHSDADGRVGPGPDAPRLMRTRRHFFRDCGVGVGKIALATLLAESQARALRAGTDRTNRPRPPHFDVHGTLVNELLA